MSNLSSTIVQKLWNYCNVLRDDGVSYSDYVEQLTYLLFLKMVDEQAQLPAPLGKPSSIPKEYDWQTLRLKDGDALEIQYRHTLENLGKEKGLLGVIFRKSQNKIQDPAKLKRLIDLINSETWIGLDIDVKGEIYEGLLQKNAEDTKNGAGQYFTPRPLIKALVEVMRPQPGQRICDPACGTGGFFLISHDYINKHYQLDKAQKLFLKHQTFKGYDVADGVVRLCAMNLHLHGISGDESPVEAKDSLRADPWTKKLWIYDFRTNQHFTLKTNPLRSENLLDFIQCFNVENRYERQETERFKTFSYEELMQRDKLSLDIFWLKDESLEDSDNLPTPDVLATEIMEDLEAALQLFQSITSNLEPGVEICDPT